MKNKSLFWILVIAMAVTVVVSNILVQYLFGSWLTWAAFTYPIAFLVTDIANRLLGTAKARQIILCGFIAGIFCSVLASLLTNEEGIPYTTLRIALGSGLAFFAAQMTDIYIFKKLQAAAWWKAPFTSTVLGSVIDSVIFFSVAFSLLFVFLEPTNDISWANEQLPLLGIWFTAPLWMSLAVADFGVKVSIGLLALLPFQYTTRRIKMESPQELI